MQQNYSGEAPRLVPQLGTESTEAYSAVAIPSMSTESSSNVSPEVVPTTSDLSASSTDALVSSAPGSLPMETAVPLPVAPQNPFELLPSHTPLPVQSEVQRSATKALPTERVPVPMSPERLLAPHPSSPTSPPRSLTPSNPSTPLDVSTAPRQPPQSAPAPSTTSGITFALEPVNSTPTVASERRPVAPHNTPQQALPIGQQLVFDDDENTEPSSAANTNEQMPSEDGSASNQQQGSHSTSDAAAGTSLSESFARFWENTRRRLSSNNHRGSEDGGIVDGSLIAGFLQKLGRNGKWQVRWFETDGECLSYYKSSKRTKVLATLDLAKVGAIEVDVSDDTGCSFNIQVLGRLYHLKASSRASCKDWVISLNRVKEARLHQGNVKLIPLSQPPDLLDTSTDMIAPRVVVVANRERTRAVAESQDWDQLIRVGENPAEPDPALDVKRRTAIGTVVLARWTKRKSSFAKIRAKLTKWARSLRIIGCMDEENVELDRHVHPPGHDDKVKKSSSSAKSPNTVTPVDGGLSAWIGKETSRTASPAAGPSIAVARPRNVIRDDSIGSEDDARMLS